MPVLYGLSETGEIFLRGIMAAPAAEVLMRVGYKSVVPVEHKGEFYFPLSWLREEFPKAELLWAVFEQRIHSTSSELTVTPTDRD